jgi:hypothetical protein
MAIITNTYETYDAANIPEEVNNKIWRIAREETPIYSSAKKEKTRSKTPEWQTQALASAATNSHAEGDAFAFDARTPTVRVKNHCQILQKGVSLTGTQQAVDHYNTESNEFKYQKMLAAIELKRDCEFAIVRENASVAGSTGVDGEIGGIETWLSTNASRGAGGAGTGYNSGTGLTVAPTDGTQRVLTQGILDGVLQTMWENGAKPMVIHVGAFNKRQISSFQGNATRYSEEKKTVSNTVDFYESDFGNLTVALNRQQRTRTMLIYDMDKIGVLNLRPMQTIKTAKTHDSDEVVLLTEFTTRVVERGLGVVADLTTA